VYTPTECTLPAQVSASNYGEPAHGAVGFAQLLAVSCDGACFTAAARWGGTLPVRAPPSTTLCLLELAHADMTTLPKVDTSCTTPSLIPTVNGNTARSFSTHGQLSAAKGSSTTSHALTSDLM
jgi:hypothetical protein